ncbi:pneumococcal-type histidine triad protein [Streptococcus sp. S784/96/1]|uniref:pneumococcal-type histidine triad protein n=1 Tax=Streptococcus sp. S784/96/1 TaxID=2653499 RepID=UPI00138669AD|nr:pneumococcal-type histidine triad protein [Streptococcus sp. S784/96/1]
MKKKYIYSSAAAILLSVSSYQIGHHQALEQKDKNRVTYISSSEQPTSNKEKVVIDTANMSPDEVSAKEGINAEQIVVKITDQGYVTSHGDHYHFYNGKVPFDAIISEELIIKDSSYALKQEDIVNEVKDGYIIKVNGTYYLYLKDAKKVTNVRTKEEIVRQQQSSGTVRPSQGNQQGTPTTTNKKSATSTKPYTTDDGYVFSPTDVIDDLGDGFLVPHGDHFHYIPKADLSPAELAAARAYWNGKKTPADNSNTPAQPQASIATVATAPVAGVQPHVPQHTAQPAPSNQAPQPTQPTQPRQPDKSASTDNLDSLLQMLYAQPLSLRHVEADGLVFDPATITKWTERGVVVPHGDHFHFIPYSQMSELEASVSRLLGQGNEANTPSKPSKPTQPSQPALPITPETVEQPVPNQPENGDSRELETPAENTIPPIPNEETTTTEENNVSESDKADTTGNVPSQPTDKPQPKPADQRAELLAYLGQYYGDKASTISYMPGIGYVITPVAGEENLILSELTVLTSKEKGEALPALGNTADGDEPEEQDSTEHNNSTETPSQPTTEEHTGPTPLAAREGKPNSQIIYSPEEIAEAKAAGRYTTSDGYIFDAKDIEREEGDAYIVPHMNHSHWIPKWDLSYSERRAAEKELASRKPVEPESSRPAPQPNDGLPRERAVDIFAKAVPAKRIPIDKMPYNSAYTVEINNGYLIIPHYNHYHNIAIARFDDLFEAPAGYSLEDLFATIKYYVENPDERPGSKDGWGRDSDIMKGRGNAENRPNYPVGEEPDEDTTEDDEAAGTSSPESKPADNHETLDTETEASSSEDDDLDDYDRDMLKRATAFGMERDAFEDKLYELAMTHGVGVDTFAYFPEQKVVRLTDRNGQIHIISLVG